MEPHLTGELGQGGQRGVGFVIRPSLEGTEEEEAHDIPGVGGGSPGSSRGSNPIGRGKVTNERGESAE